MYSSPHSGFSCAREIRIKFVRGYDNFQMSVQSMEYIYLKCVFVNESPTPSPSTWNSMMRTSPFHIMHVYFYLHMTRFLKNAFDLQQLHGSVANMYAKMTLWIYFADSHLVDGFALQMKTKAFEFERESNSFSQMNWKFAGLWPIQFTTFLGPACLLSTHCLRTSTFCLCD